MRSIDFFEDLAQLSDFKHLADALGRVVDPNLRALPGDGKQIPQRAAGKNFDAAQIKDQHFAIVFLDELLQSFAKIFQLLVVHDFEILKPNQGGFSHQS